MKNPFERLPSMNEKALHILEFDKITDLLTSRATSEAGRELCRSLTPMTDTGAIDAAQTETASGPVSLLSMKLSDGSKLTFCISHS